MVDSTGPAGARRYRDDARATVGVFSDGSWHILSALSSDAEVVSFDYGSAGDQPITGQWSD